ncbi:GntR family transcriptional regulator [uncultured Cohaesibacter sp.]|uniref:GntR family transcriptional regulator n=1 Tax=uncultured Cohaesibacter sp. TaxID=1002546 RepID=UPI0029C81B89|nr:GntR family transcriptional regulator [uncultured Cohaesibacter sp.]
MQEITRPPSLSDIATEKLRIAIMNGEFKLGEALSEKKLADRLNISKTPIRHALAQMRVEGLVEVFPQKGSFVFTLSGMDLVRFSEHRVILETAALELAFERNLDALVSRLKGIWEKMLQAKKSSSIQKYLEMDIEFHRCFFQFADNSYLAESYSLIEAKISAIRTHLGRDVIQTDKSLEEHHEMVIALEKGDLDKCISVLEFHIGRYHRTYSEDVMDISNPADALSN